MNTGLSNSGTYKISDFSKSLSSLILSCLIFKMKSLSLQRVVVSLKWNRDFKWTYHIETSSSSFSRWLVSQIPDLIKSHSYGFYSLLSLPMESITMFKESWQALQNRHKLMLGFTVNSNEGIYYLHWS